MSTNTREVIVVGFDAARHIEKLETQLAQVTRENEQFRAVSKSARDALRQLASLANVNDETRRMLIRTGNALNAALAMGKEK